MSGESFARRTRLLNPGPVTLTPRVRGALAGEDLCHREPEFARLQQEIRAWLAGVYAQRGEHTAVLIAGSGTAAVEAMVGTLVPRDGRALVVVNGVYGERMAAMLAAQGRAHEVVASDWLAPIDLAAVAQRLASPGAPRVSHVLAVHHETTTGRLNDVGALGAICRQHGVSLLLDAVSSFGGEAIELDAWNVEACAATANKCLHGAPGVSFVLAREASLTRARGNACSVYLDLSRQHAEQARGSSAFTQPVHVCHALLAALCELEERGGWPARRAHYRALSTRAFDALVAQGVRPLLEIAAPSSATLTSYRMPLGRAYRDLHAALKAQGFVIYAGQGALSDEIFRIAVMGDLGEADIDELAAACAAHWSGSPSVATSAPATRSELAP